MKTGWQGQGLGEVGKEERERQGQVAEQGRRCQAGSRPPHSSQASEASLGLACVVSGGKRAGK